MEKYMLPCLFKKMFGLDCVGCGMQRSFLLLCKGEITAAFYMFPAIFTSLAFGIIVLLHFFDKSHNYHVALRGMAILNAAIMILAYIYKMTNFN